MNGKVRQSLLGGGVLIAGAWCAWSYLGGLSPRAANAVSVAPGATAPTAAVAETEEPACCIELPADLPWPPDPFRCDSRTQPAEIETTSADAAKPPAEQQYVLNAILDGTDPRAIVDGLVVAVGARLRGDATVAAIDAFAVTLVRADGRREILRLPE